MDFYYEDKLLRGERTVWERISEAFMGNGKKRSRIKAAAECLNKCRKKNIMKRIDRK